MFLGFPNILYYIQDSMYRNDLIELISNCNDEMLEQVIRCVENIQHEDELNDLFESNVKPRFGKKNSDITLVNSLYNVIVKNVDFSTNDKKAILELISNDRNLIQSETFKTPLAQGNVDDLISPQIVNSPLYPMLKQYLLNRTGGKATGKGERYLKVFGATSKSISRKGDITVEDVCIEVKEGGSTTSSIDSGLKENRRNIDDLNRKLLTGLDLDDEDIIAINSTKAGKVKKGVKLDFSNELIVKAFKKYKVDGIGKRKLHRYFKLLYGYSSNGLNDSEIDEIVDIVYDNLGKPNKEIAKYILPYVFKMYKRNKGFDSFIMLNQNGDYIVTNSDELPIEKLQIKDWVLVQGGNTYTSLPPGYINISF